MDTSRLPYPCPPFQIIRISSVDVIYLVSSQQDMPQIRVELYLLRICSAFYLYSAEPFVPYRQCTVSHLPEVPVAAFLVHVLPCICNAHIRHGRFQQNLFPRLHFLKVGFHSSGRRLFERRTRHLKGFRRALHLHNVMFPLCPGPTVQRPERTVKAYHKVHTGLIYSSPYATCGIKITGNLRIAHARSMCIHHRGGRNMASQVQQDFCLSRLGISQPVKADPLGHRLLYP